MLFDKLANTVGGNRCVLTRLLVSYKPPLRQVVALLRRPARCGTPRMSLVSMSLLRYNEPSEWPRVLDTPPKHTPSGSSGASLHQIVRRT